MAVKYNNKASFEITGVSELLKKIEKANGNINEAVKKAIDKSVQIPANQMLSFIKQHRYSGLTEDSFVKETQVDGKGKITVYVGFSIRKGGLAAIFLNVGSPTNEPSFFIDYAVENNLDEIYKAQQDALKEVLKELMV